MDTSDQQKFPWIPVRYIRGRSDQKSVTVEDTSQQKTLEDGLEEQTVEVQSRAEQREIRSELS
jgi:hypothetical protein